MTKISILAIAAAATVYCSRIDAFVVSSSSTSSSSSPSTVFPSSSSQSSRLFYGRDLNQAKNNLVISSPVLQQVYPELLKYVEQYGHPNIPLGSKEGRQCVTLRRLHTQQKLTPDEVAWLDSLGFTWHSLEDVYRYANFDDLLQRLIDYERRHPDSHFQVPKKCPEDPELGAWVTGLRRLGPDGVNPEHERRLDALGFVWISARQCGSKFMEQYRLYTSRVQQEGRETVLAEESTVQWIKAQQEVMKRGKLSQTRVHYMGQLFGEDWTTV